MSRSKAFGAFIIVLQLAGLVAFTLSFHAIFNVLSSSFSGDEFSLELTIDQSAGLGTLTLNADPRNGGYLPVDVSLELAVVDGDGEYIARDSAAGYIGAGGRQPFVLSLTIPQEEIQKATQGEGEFFVEITYDIRTLEDLVGVSNTFRLPGGGFE